MSLPSPARGKGLAVSILSLSLLTVMAGAAVAPALGVIQAYFSGTSQTVVQLIISIPALFIVITNLCFPALSRRFSTKTLVLGGLLLYTVGGCAAGLFDQIALVLVMRALVGVGVGILMPLSTGLLTFYYPPERQAALMGYASAMNQMGGVIATLLAGLLSQLNWRASFLVYLLGLLSIVLCLGFLPSDRLDQPQHAEEASAAGSPFRTYFVYILAMFLLMSIFSPTSPWRPRQRALCQPNASPSSWPGRTWSPLSAGCCLSISGGPWGAGASCWPPFSSCWASCC